MHKALLLIGILCGALLSQPAVQATSLVFKGEDWEYLRPAAKVWQEALISHDSGRERLYISVNMKCGESENYLWIFPVPARRGQIAVVLARYNNLGPASPPEWVLRESLWYASFATRWTHFFWACPLMSLDCLANGFGVRGLYIRVTCWDETRGKRVSVLQPRSLLELHDQLQKIGAEVSPGDLGAFQPYMRPDFSLIAVRVPSAHERGLMPGHAGECYLDLTFPTVEGFYPVQGGFVSEGIRIADSVQVVGLQRADRSKSSEVTNHRGFGVPSFLSEWPNQGDTWKWGRTFTIFSCGSRLASESGDLWFRPFSSRRTSLLLACLWLLGRKPFLLPIVFLISACFCYLSGGLAGVVVFREWRTFARLGLWNLLSIVGLAVAVFNQPGTAFRGREDGSGALQNRLKFLLAFTATFMTSTEITWWRVMLLVDGMR